MDAVGAVFAAKALGLAMALPVAFLLLAGMGLASALPSTPGYVGIYQFVAVSVLHAVRLSTRTNAIAYILLVQALTYLVIGCWGAIGFWQYRRMAPHNIALSGLPSSREIIPPPPHPKSPIQH